MTPQEVIKSFMASLRDNSSLSGTSMLDAAVKASSKYSGVQDVIDAMKADQIAAEKEAVEEVLGSDYAGQTISDVASGILKATAKTYDTNNIGNAYYNSSNDNRTTVERLIKERKAIIFLEKYCGIQLNNNYWITSSDVVTAYNGDTTGNVDTGAITGSDANITLKAGDEVNGTILTPAIMQAIAEKDGVSLSGDTLIIGTGTEKIEYSIVPEIGNKYTATTSQAQNIKTGSNDWIVVATSGNDTITTGGADSVDAGAGSDKIIVGADYASIKTGAGSDTVEISAEVKNITIQDLTSSDLLTISGTFEVGTAKIEDTMLVVTDKTGMRQIRLGDLDNAKNAKIDASTTIANWLTKAGIDLNNLPTSSGKIISESIETEASIVNKEDDSGRIAIDPDYTPAPKPVEPTEETENQPHRSSNTTGNVNVNLDNVTLQSGNYNVDGSKVGEISNEFPNISKYTKNGLTIYLAGVSSDTGGDPDKIESKTYNQLTADQKTIVAGLFKWWAKEALQLNEESYGISFDSDSAMVKEIGLYFYNSKGSGNTLAAVYNWSTSGTGQNTTKLMLNVNLNYYSGIADTNFDGESSSTSGFLDRTLAHEFTHAIMASNIHYFNSLPQFIKEGSAELTHGIDDERGQPIFGIAYDASRLNNALSLTNTGTGTADAYAGGYMFFRYLARQAALQTLFDGVVIPGDDNPLLITLTANADNYSNTLEGATIMAFDGDDTIENNAVNVTINAGAGNDSIGNHGGYDNGNDLIDAGDGDDTIDNHVHNVTLRGGAGNDSIYNGDTALIEGGEGNDSIISENFNGSPVTINAGAGSDYISLHSGNQSNLILYNIGDGSDTIYGFNENSTLKFGSGISNYSTIKSGSDIFIMVDANALVLKDAATLSGINIVDNQDNVLEHAPIKGTANADNISNNFNKVSILAYDGDDTIANYGNNVTIDAGNGNDWIESGSKNVTVNAGEGNDTIKNTGDNLLIQYAKIDGYDLIQGFNATSTLDLASAKYATTKSGNDLIINVIDSGNITLAGGATLDALNIIGTYSEDTTPSSAILTLDNASKAAITLDSDIKYANASARTKAIRITGNALDNSIIGGTANDILEGLTGNDTLTGGNGADIFIYTGGNDVITDYAANDKISLASDLTYDNYAISGSDLILGYGTNNSLTIRDGNNKAITFVAGKKSTVNVYTAEGIFDAKKTSATLVATSSDFDAADYPALVVIDGSQTGAIKITGNAKANNIIAGAKGSTLNGGTGNDILQGGNGSDIFIYDNKSGNKTIVNYDAGDKISLDSNATLADAWISKKGDAVLKVSGNTLTVKNSFDKEITLTANGNDIIYNGSVFSDTAKTNATLPATFAKEFNLGTFKNADSSSRTGAIKITGNAQNNSIAGSKKNDILDGAGGDDTLIGGDGADTFVYTGGKDVITDYAANDKISVASNLTYDKFTINGDDLILGYGTNNSLTVKDGKDTAININSAVKIYSDNLTFDAKKTSVTLAATSSDFDAADYPALVVIDGSQTNAIKITGNAKANNIIAGAKGSTLNGGTGNDILQGGNGSDIFIYDNKSGNKTIVDYGTGDKISLDNNATLIDASVNKKGDTLLKVGSNTITIKDTSEVTIISNGDELIYGGGLFSNTAKTNATLPATFAKEFNMGAFTNVDSSLRSGAIKITGNEKNNSIFGGKGNDTLDGATGNDTLAGGAGKNIFIYSNGNDFITDYEAKDKISIDGELVYTNYAINGDNVVLNYSGNNSLTIKDAKDKTITSFTGKKSTVNVYSPEGIFDAKKTVATLASSTTNFDASTDYSALVVIDGSAATEAIKITGNAKANRIIAGNYGSTLNGGIGNDMLIGGNGADIFIYENNSGKKVIDNYGTGDKISLGAGATITDASTKNDVSTIKIGSNFVTLKSSDATFVSDGIETIYSGGIFTIKDTAKVYGSYTGTINLSANVKIADAALASKAVTVQGGTADDSITGGASADKLHGNAGSDTLYGGAGKGNDSLWGGAGNDNFIYKANEGNDIIADYAAGDLVTILDKQGNAGTFSKATFGNNTLTMNINGGGSLTLKDVTSSTNFNINGENYHVDGKTIAK